MARSIWSGAISFGLVNIPVSLYTAIVSHDVHFRQLQRGTGERIRYRRIAEGSGEEVEYKDIVKGFELHKGQYVVIDPKELEAVEPTRTRTIDIEEFVDLAQIDPIVWNATYYLAPSGQAGADRPYVLLRRAMEETGKVAIARFVMRTKQYLATLRPMGDLIVLETMHFADEIRSTAEVENAPGRVTVAKREVDMARQLIVSLSADWDHAKYADTYRERVMALIERKAKGEELVAEPAARKGPKVVNLMDALKASLKTPRTDAANGALEALPKRELMHRASKADIAGRSRMSKRELVRALERLAS